MGASNVAAAYAHWRGHLSHRELHALVFMALTSLDADRPPIYFGGWESIATQALGLDLEGNPASAKRTTFQVLAGLRSKGAASSSGQAHSGVRAVYALNLIPGREYIPQGTGRDITWTARERGSATLTHSPEDQGAHRSPNRERPAHPSVSAPHTQMGERPVSKKVSAPLTPRNHDEPQGGTREEPREEPVITSQPNPGTRVRETRRMNDDDPPSQTEDERRNAQAAALRQMFPDEFPASA